MFGAELINANLKWRIGNGNSVKFWHDKWCSSQALSNFALPSITFDSNACVSDFWDEMVGMWTYYLLFSLLIL